jgi:streptogramin lyase
VNLNGDMAVANRLSGVTKITARVEQCNDPANTSQNGADIRPWMDGCIAWFTPFVYASQRPVAWTQGEFDDGTCRYENTKLWTSGANASIDVILIDGETGVVEQTVPIPGVPPNFYGIYGGAVDSEGNFWGSQLGLGYLVRVDIDDFSVQTWPMNQSGYGMTVDGEGRPWTCAQAVARFDPNSMTWMANATAGASGGGCMVDGDGVLWVGGYDQVSYANVLLGFDTETLSLVQTIPIPNYAKGISIDFEGNVWAVSYTTDAYRVNPVTQQIDTFTGLIGPYTYSDMTGFALSQAGGAAG